jgi:hypothetical protein
VAEGNIPGGPPVRAAAPVVAPQWPGVALFAVVCAAFCACHWAIAWPAKPFASFWVEQARGIGIVMMLFALPAGLVTRKPLLGLRLVRLRCTPGRRRKIPSI